MGIADADRAALWVAVGALVAFLAFVLQLRALRARSARAAAASRARLRARARLMAEQDAAFERALRDDRARCATTPPLLTAETFSPRDTEDDVDADALPPPSIEALRAARVAHFTST